MIILVLYVYIDVDVILTYNTDLKEVKYINSIYILNFLQVNVICQYYYKYLYDDGLGLNIEFNFIVLIYLRGIIFFCIYYYVLQYV